MSEDQDDQQQQQQKQEQEQERILTDFLPLLSQEHFFSFRSGIEADWRCPRMGYLNQIHLGIGIEKAPRPVWLDVGSAVHIGLGEFLLNFTTTVEGELVSRNPADEELPVDVLAERCILKGLDYFKRSGQEQALDNYQYNEQYMLIEALLWSFYYYTLAAFLNRYEVMYVEEEVLEDDTKENPMLTFMSRADAVCLDRDTRELALISWKTIDDVTDWRRLFFKQDLQGLLESYYAEVLLKRVKVKIEEELRELATGGGLTVDRVTHLQELLAKWKDAPEKITYVQTIYLVKGKRMKEGAPEGGNGEGGAPQEAGGWEDDNYETAWRQNTFLVYPWVHQGVQGKQPAFASLSWKWRFQKPGNKSLSTLGAGFKRELVGLTGLTVQQWVKDLNERKVFPSTLETEEGNPLTRVVVWENPSYRSAEFMKDIVSQVRGSETCRFIEARAINRGLASILSEDRPVKELTAEEQLRLMLNAYFPQRLVSCNFPWKCQFQRICYRPEVPLLGVPDGYKLRVPHHEPELRIKMEQLRVLEGKGYRV